MDMQTIVSQYQSLGLTGVSILFVWRFGRWLLPTLDKIVSKYVETQDKLSIVMTEMNVISRSIDARLTLIERVLLEKEKPT